jgi:hypothetical protein
MPSFRSEIIRTWTGMSGLIFVKQKYLEDTMLTNVTLSVSCLQINVSLSVCKIQSDKYCPNSCPCWKLFRSYETIRSHGSVTCCHHWTFECSFQLKIYCVGGSDSKTRVIQSVHNPGDCGRFIICMAQRRRTYINNTIYSHKLVMQARMMNRLCPVLKRTLWLF